MIFFVRYMYLVFSHVLPFYSTVIWLEYAYLSPAFNPSQVVSERAVFYSNTAALINFCFSNLLICQEPKILIIVADMSFKHIDVSLIINLVCFKLSFLLK